MSVTNFSRTSDPNKITRRDLFAAAALTGLLSCGHMAEISDAVILADAMIKVMEGK